MYLIQGYGGCIYLNFEWQRDYVVMNTSLVFHWPLQQPGYLQNHALILETITLCPNMTFSSRFRKLRNENFAISLVGGKTPLCCCLPVRYRA
jgi:hypothetical protein